MMRGCVAKGTGDGRGAQRGERERAREREMGKGFCVLTAWGRASTIGCGFRRCIKAGRCNIKFLTCFMEKDFVERINCRAPATSSNHFRFVRDC